MSRSRYIIGVDLGTSNSALSFVDTLSEDSSPQILDVVQLEAISSLKTAQTLPSFLYFGTDSEKETGALALDFQSEDAPRGIAVGAYALNQTAYLPGRVVSSAKSWLCHGGVDREEAILPWGSDEIQAEDRLSPVQVSAFLLRHFLDVWNSSVGGFHEDYCFEKQDVTITVPASFDEAAQRLTLAAAHQAGYPQQTRLLEEPQAAFYHWLEEHDPQQLFSASECASPHDAATVLICDIGGGTSDFSLFKITGLRQGSREPEIRRVSVSDHILLGGDNIDLTLAHQLERKLLGLSQDEEVARRLSARQWRHLVFASRSLKERVLNEEQGDNLQEEFHVSVPAEGSSLFSSSMTAAISREQVREIVLEGFFPFCSAEEELQKHGAALKEWGLPFAADSRVSCHLAAFLEKHRVDAVLYNGGTLKPEFLRSRLTEIISSWQDGSVPIQLEAREMELAVARGAAAFGKVLRQARGRIKGGYARSLYMELFSEEMKEKPELVCILPRGFEESQRVVLEQPEFKMLVAEPVRFQLFQSTHRAEDKLGDVVSFNEQDFRALPPLQTVITLKEGTEAPQDGLVKIQLESAVNELGMLQVYCLHEAGEEEAQRWQLDFNLRNTLEAQASGAEYTEEGGTLSKELKESNERISLFFGKKKQVETKLNPKTLLKDLERIFRKERSEWETALLRSLWPALAKGITRRGRSLTHETSWLYLAGFVLRPGYGADLDEWRIKELWRCFQLGLSFPRENRALIQWWIMWRRVAGGLDEQQQKQLYKKIASRLEKKGSDDPELFRLAGSLERIELSKKTALGDSLVRRISGRKSSGIEALIWSFGRLTSRVPLYASAHQVVPAQQVVRWFDKLSGLDWSKGDFPKLNAAFSQACRFTSDRERDISSDVRLQVLRKMEQSGASEEQLRVVREYVELDLGDRVKLFGEALPAGLRLA